jgi:hypothetical protein
MVTLFSLVDFSYQRNPETLGIAHSFCKNLKRKECCLQETKCRGAIYYGDTFSSATAYAFPYPAHARLPLDEVLIRHG